VLPGFEVVGWYGVIGPANLPGPIVARLHEEFTKVLSQPEVRERIVADGSEPIGSTPEDFRQFMLADLANGRSSSSRAGRSWIDGAGVLPRCLRSDREPPQCGGAGRDSR